MASPPEPVCLLSTYAATVAGWGFIIVAAKFVPVASMRWSTTASLRASATFAFLMPARWATPSAQLLRSEPFTARVRITWAAS